MAFQYGPDERAVTLAGSGEFKFGAQPQLQGMLSARQVDLDRLLATPDAPRRLPLAAVQAFGEMLGSALRPSWPVKLALNVDAMTLGGAPVQNVASDLRSDGTTWTLDRLELRAPGFTQVKVDGRLYPLGKGLGFAGGASVDSNDPKNLVAWLAGQATTAAQYKPWRAKGDVTLRADRIAVEQLRTEIDRGVVEGSVSYAWPAGDRPARLDGELRAAELDLDGVLGFGESALSGLGLERPGEVTLAMEIGRAKIAGFDARTIAARLKLDAGGLAIERLSIGDLGDTAFVATGRIQTQSSPGGSITVNLDSRDLSGIQALSERFAPALAGPLRRLAARQKTATLQASVSMESSGADGASGKIGLTGKVGAIRVNVSASATGKREAFMVTDLGALAGADVHIDGRFEADGSGPLLGLLGLDRVVAADSKPARLDVSANGPLGRELRFEGKLAAGPIDAGGKGTLRFASDQPATLDFDQFAGMIGGNNVQGRGALRFDDVLSDRRVDRGGIAGRAGRGRGRDRNAVAIRRGRGRLVARADRLERNRSERPYRRSRRNARCSRRGSWRRASAAWRGSTVRRSCSRMSRANWATAASTGGSPLSNGAAGLTARLRLGLADAELGAIFPSTDRPATSGRLALQTEIEGVGRSPAAFIGSLTGFGTVTLEQARLVGLNPEVFGAVTRADRAWNSDRGQSHSRIRRRRARQCRPAGVEGVGGARASTPGRRGCATSSSRPTAPICRRPSTSISPTPCSMLCSRSTRRHRRRAPRGRP